MKCHNNDGACTRVDWVGYEMINIKVLSANMLATIKDESSHILPI